MRSLFIEESARDNQEALEKRDKMLRDTVAELCEAKRLLKAAVDDMSKEADCGICLHDDDGGCPIEVATCKFKWRYADEALALIGEEGGNNA